MNIGAIYTILCRIDSRCFVFFRLSADTSQYAANKIHKSLTASRGVIAEPTQKPSATKQATTGTSCSHSGYLYYAIQLPRISCPLTPPTCARHAPALANLALCCVARRGAKWRHYEKRFVQKIRQVKIRHAPTRRPNPSHPRRRRQPSRRRRPGQRADQSHFHLHVFLDRRNEALGRRQKQSLHLHPLRQPIARHRRRQNRRPRRRRSRRRHRLGHGRHLPRAPRRAEIRRRSYLLRPTLRRHLPPHARRL